MDIVKPGTWEKEELGLVPVVTVVSFMAVVARCTERLSTGELS